MDSTVPCRFDVALSFPGERRDFVGQVAAKLASVFGEQRILYDRYHDAELARPDLNLYLPALYRTRSTLVVIFLCPEYGTKLWCRLEWRHISQLIATVDAERIMFLSFGNPGDLSELGILRGDGYIDILQLTPEVVTEKIIKRLRYNQGIIQPPTPSILAPKAACKVDLNSIDRYAPRELIGRDTELKLLSNAWTKVMHAESQRPHVITFIALGGEGKTSLVAKWAANLAAENWESCDAAFSWSFYSQGTTEKSVASSDLFLRDALNFFGDAAMADSPRMAVDKAKRLAELVGERRAVLILDGLEPLQYPPTSPLRGELKDKGIATLLKGLAIRNRGLCVVTSRYSVPDLRNYWHTVALEIPLLRLSNEAGVALLKSLGVKHGLAEDLEELVEDVRGHALTLNLLGAYLHDAHAGDLRKRDLASLDDADAEEQGGHAFRIMDAYVKWFESDGVRGRRAIGVLRLLGLFDRPATADCIAELKQPPVIPDFTEPLVGMTDAQWNIALTRLEEANLLTVNRDACGAPLTLDAHPLIREYFASRTRAQLPEAWRAAHRRLYEYLRATTKDKPDPTLEDLKPLYQAVTHGCQADLHQSVWDEVHWLHIRREQTHFSLNRLGAFSTELSALAEYFSEPWSRPSPQLSFNTATVLLNDAGDCLRALGRLSEAADAMREALRRRIAGEDWRYAAIVADNLGQVLLAQGNISEALTICEESVRLADRSEDFLWRVVTRAKVGNALHEQGRFAEAMLQFGAAEEIQAEHQPESPFLVALPGYQYCDLLLTTVQDCLRTNRMRETQDRADHATVIGSLDAALECCVDVSKRAKRVVETAEVNRRPLHVGLGLVAFARAQMLYKLFSKSSVTKRSCDTIGTAIVVNGQALLLPDQLDAAVANLRNAGYLDFLLLGLLARAHLRAVEEHLDQARADLDEAWEIAERGPMKLFMADIHLHRANLFFREKQYPWHKNPNGTSRGPKDDLLAARDIINTHGYHRCDQELADANRVILIP